jgi:hypothetical protein
MAFTAATAVQQTDSHTYTADFKEDWCIGSGKEYIYEVFEGFTDVFQVPHGGYVTAIFQVL